MITRHRAAFVFAGIGLFLGLAIGMLLSPLIAPSNAAPAEDQPGWSCVDDGNKVCGPGNAQGAPAGCYDEGGVLAAPWPCSWHTLDNGDRLLITADGDAQLYFPLSPASSR